MIFKHKIRKYHNKLSLQMGETIQPKVLFPQTTHNTDKSSNVPHKSKMSDIMKSVTPNYNEYTSFKNYLETWRSLKHSPSEKKIPLNLFQTYHTLDVPVHMKKNIDELKKKNPEFTYKLFDDAMCRDFIQNHFDEHVLHAFDSLIPGAYRADLWRYCVLYIHGGIYIDIKFKCVNNFKLIELLDKEYYVKDRLSGGQNGIYRAFMVNLPKNPVLIQCIQQIVQNVKNRFYGKNSLCITGPQLMSNYFSQSSIRSNELYHGPEGCCIYIGNSKIIDHYSQYRKEQRDTQKTDYYATLWKKKQVYRNV